MADSRATLYLRAGIVFAALALLMLFLSIYLVGQVNSLQTSTERNEQQAKAAALNARAACERANGLRSAVRFLIVQQKGLADIASRASSSAEIRGYLKAVRGQYAPYLDLAGVKQRNCAADYPLP